MGAVMQSFQPEAHIFLESAPNLASRTFVNVLGHPFALPSLQQTWKWTTPQFVEEHGLSRGHFPLP